MASARLYGEAVPAQGLSGSQVERLSALYQEHYDGADPARFRADLAEKEWAILLRERETGLIVGFSTQMLIDATVQGRSVRALFSGDTIIHRAYWGSQELVRTWCRFAGQAKALDPVLPLYWFLISKGHRTYLYLPLFFETFSPRHDRETPPFEEQLLDTLSRARYGAAYNPETGLIRHADLHDRLKPDLDASPSRESNPHVRFFLQKNPAYAEGTELACVAEISPENMRSLARRELEAGLRAGPLREE
jgi:hypothetical protein